MIIAVDIRDEPSRRDDRIDGLSNVSQMIKGWSRKVLGHTVYAQMRMMPIKTEKNTQAVQNLVLSPLNKLAAVAAAMTIVVENSY